MLLCSVVANAHDFEVDGIYYDVISFTDFTVAVTYKGDSYGSFSNEYTGDVVIPSTVTYKSKTLSVTKISQYAFYDCSLKSISIPSSVIFIDNYAFKSCPIENLRIEDGTETLSLGCNYDDSNYNYGGEGLFYSSRTLETLYLGRNLSYETGFQFGYSPFFNLTKLTSVTIGNSVTSIEDYAFSSCSSLTSIVVDKGNTVYDSRNNCNAIIKTASNTLIAGCKNTIIPSGVTSIGNLAFTYCSGLTSVTIGNSVRSIEDGAFYSCTSLKDLRIEDGETTLSLGYNFYMFYDCPLESLYLGRNLDYNTSSNCGYSPFYNKKTLKSVTIGNSVTSI